MVKIETWKKILIIVGSITQVLGYFMDSSALIMVGLISIISGTIAIFSIK